MSEKVRKHAIDTNILTKEKKRFRLDKMIEKISCCTNFAKYLKIRVLFKTSEFSSAEFELGE